jgi:hypothetical protein
MIINHDIGHDAGLYHVPFQSWIKNYKITFGLFNLHSRYALNTSYDYISALFWIGDNFTIISFFQAIYLNIFILFLYDLLKEKNDFSILLLLPTTLSFLLWQRYSNIDYVILNPTWTVPSSIVGREMYNLIVKNPNYLTKNNYQVLKNGEVINPNSINWRKYSPGNIPFTIRQNAGDDNSLGKIKFTFKNPFDVYLHDTPLKNKFKLNNRAVSHGCVRVQSPVDLTGFVLQQNTKTVFLPIF